MTTTEKSAAGAVPAAAEKKNWRTSGGVRGWFGRQHWAVRTVLIIVFAVLAYLLPYAGDIPLIGPQIITEGIDWPSALFNMSYYVLLALGLNVVVGFAGLLDLGYVGFFAVGAYTVAMLTSPDSVLHTEWAWLAAIPVALAITMVSGLLLGWPTLRLRGDYLAIVTLGFAEIIRIFATSSETLRGDRGFSDIPHPPGSYADGKPIFGVADATPYYWLGLTVIIAIMIFRPQGLIPSRRRAMELKDREKEVAPQ